MQFFLALSNCKEDNVVFQNNHQQQYLVNRDFSLLLLLFRKRLCAIWDSQNNAQDNPS